MDVGVEDLEVFRKLVSDQLLEALDERLRARKDVLHCPESTDWDSARADGVDNLLQKIYVRTCLCETRPGTVPERVSGEHGGSGLV
jgi:hypothetical protein